MLKKQIQKILGLLEPIWNRGGIESAEVEELLEILFGHEIRKDILSYWLWNNDDAEDIPVNEISRLHDWINSYK